MAQLSEAIIRKAVREAVRNFLNEGLTDKEYHFCSLNFVHSICQTNEIHLTMATNLGDATDKYNRFYLSLSRTRNVYESYGVNRTCRIEFDGTALKRYGFAGRPLNYNAVKGDDNKWYGTKGDRSRQFEYEDRLLFTDPVIENANKYMNNEAKKSPVPGKESLILITCIGDWSETQQTYLSRQFVRAVLVTNL